MFVLLFLLAARALPIEPAKVILFLCVGALRVLVRHALPGSRGFRALHAAVRNGRCDQLGRSARQNGGARSVAREFREATSVVSCSTRPATDIRSGFTIGPMLECGADRVGAKFEPESDNQALLHYYPDRKAWLLLPDSKPPLLTPYFETPAGRGPEPVMPAPYTPPSYKSKGKLIHRCASRIFPKNECERCDRAGPRSSVGAVRRRVARRGGTHHAQVRRADGMVHDPTRVAADRAALAIVAASSCTDAGCV